MTRADGDVVQGPHNDDALGVVLDSPIAFYVILEHLDEVKCGSSNLDVELKFNSLTVNVESF